MTNASDIHTGHCLCGAVRFEVSGMLAEPHACHCEQCRRQSGHFVASTHVPRSAFTLTEDRGLRWYTSSDVAQRGFCAECGTAMLWDDGGEDVYISMGCFDQPTGVRLARHIFADEKGDYYDIDDGLPAFVGFDKPLKRT